MCFKKVKNSNNEFGHMVFCGWSHGKNKVRYSLLDNALNYLLSWEHSAIKKFVEKMLTPIIYQSQS